MGHDTNEQAQAGMGRVRYPLSHEWHVAINRHGVGLNRQLCVLEE